MSTIIDFTPEQIAEFEAARAAFLLELEILLEAHPQYCADCDKVTKSFLVTSNLGRGLYCQTEYSEECEQEKSSDTTDDI